MRFFWRIFLSAWAIVLVTTVLTAWATQWLTGDGDREAAPLADRAIALVARDLQGALERDPTQPITELARSYSVDSSPLLQIYVLDRDGRDVLGQPLPEAVAEAVASRNDAGAPAPVNTARVRMRSEGLRGYTVVAYSGYFPIARILVTPGGPFLYLAFALAVSISVSWLLARFIVRPVRQLQLAGQKVATGDLSVRVAHTVGGRTDDIAKLAHDFDAMTERVDALLEARHRLLRDVSHELRSPLARLQALLSIARQKGSASNGDLIDRMEVELERLDDLIGEILAFSRLEAQESVTRRATDIVDLVQNIVDDASLEGQPAGKDVQLQAPPRLVISVESGLIQSAVENVVRNAVKYTAEGTTVEVRVLAEENAVRIVVDDRGPGVPQQSIEKIFEAFYRVEDSRSTRSGTGGIGLAIARHGVRLHGGTITAVNRESGGLRVEILLPAAH